MNNVVVSLQILFRNAMKLYSLSVLYKGSTKANLLKAAYDLSSFSFFQRSSVQEFMTFTSALIVERSALGSRASIKEQEYLCHVYVRNDNLGGVVIADSEYPSRVCFTLLDKVRYVDHLSIYLSIHQLSIHQLSIHLSVHPSGHPSIHLSIRSSIHHPSVHLSISSSIHHPSIYNPYVHLSSIHPSVRSVHLRDCMALKP
uniref:YKT6 v-SNARE homolog (S. cerevisiae) n=1 Tax=Sinocyclocheilus grahami TaxID=75366 RepID=A0A672KBC2_SINGR